MNKTVRNQKPVPMIHRTDTSVPNRDMYRAAFREEGKKVYLTAEGVGSMLWVEGVGTLRGLVYDFRHRSGIGGGEKLYLCSDLSTGQVFYQRR